MTDKEKLEKLKKLADAMYYAANYLTTDASRLHKAMDEYHKYIIHEYKEEPVSVWHDPKEMPPDDIIVFRYIDGLTTCRYVGQTMKGVLAWAYFKDIKNL